MATKITDLFIIGIILFVLLLGIITLIPTVNAYYYVQQGDNVSLGDTVDLTGVYGWSGNLGWWKNTYYEGGSHEPDLIIDLNDYFKVEVVYLDPTIWKTGNWYQWDGSGEDSHSNNFVFSIKPQTNFTITGKTSTKVKVNISETQEPTMPPTIVPTPVPTTPIPILTTPIPTRTLPPPRGLPTDPLIVAIGVIGAVLLFLKFRKEI